MRHPDEFHFVYWPLYFATGDLDPQHTLTAFYPALHYYFLGLLYFVYFILQHLTNGWSLEQFAAYHFFWDTDSLLQIARWTGVAFAVGTVAWVAFLARRIAGPMAGYVAALLVACAPLHVRQSGLAAVDVPMAFWYVGAVWAAVRLLERSSWKAYALAGVLVGLAAASKYPGALSAAAVVAAHWSARRSWCDRRLWIAGALSIATFFCATPYTLLDWQVFSGHFAREAVHLQGGHGQSLGVGWWYHIKMSLRYGLGWPGLSLGFAGLLVAWRSREGRVLIAGFAAYYVVMGSGELVFVRYALPLLVLLAVLAALALTALARTCSARSGHMEYMHWPFSHWPNPSMPRFRLLAYRLCQIPGRRRRSG
ncbi:MAG: ArnT family glycosyltransferase [Candidatus Latescibacterota bacterium]